MTIQVVGLAGIVAIFVAFFNVVLALLLEDDRSIRFELRIAVPSFLVGLTLVTLATLVEKFA